MRRESLEVAGPIVAVPTIDAVGCSADGKGIFIKAVNTDSGKRRRHRNLADRIAIASHANTSSTAPLASPGRLF